MRYPRSELVHLGTMGSPFPYEAQIVGLGTRAQRHRLKHSAYAEEPLTVKGVLLRFQLLRLHTELFTPR